MTKTMNTLRHRINGKKLAQHVGQEVILLGTITKKSSNGQNVEFQTTDDVQVNVTFPEPMHENLEGYVELHGTLQSRSTMLVENYVHFPPEQSGKFGVKQYNDYLAISNVLGANKWALDESGADV